MMLEKEVERKLRLMVERLGGRCWKFTSPGHSGVPDRLILLPGGRVVFAEVKRPKGSRIAPLQREAERLLTGLGFLAVFVRSSRDVDDLEILLRDYMKGGSC